MQPERDIVVAQNLGSSSNLIALVPHEKSFVSVFALNQHSTDSHRYLLMRIYDENGNMSKQKRIRLPETIGLEDYVNSQDEKFIVEKSQYRVRITTHQPNKPDNERKPMEFEITFP